MNIQQLKYVLEVWRCGSISKAAKRLYINQPNLSRSIKELEAEFDIVLFSRTSSGVEVTREGREFLRQAEKLVSSAESFEHTFKNARSEEMSFKIAVPRVSYLANAFSQAVSMYADDKNRHIVYRETGNQEIIDCVASQSYDIGIIRFPVEFESEYKKLLVDMHLRYQELFTFRFVVTMSRSHPLAGRERLWVEDLKPYVALVHGDNRSSFFPDKETDRLYLSDISDNIIQLYERGSQFDFLRNISGCYMLVSPLPKDILKANELVQIPLAEEDVGMFVDLLIMNRNRRYSSFERSLITHIIDVQQEVMYMTDEGRDKNAEA